MKNTTRIKIALGLTGSATSADIITVLRAAPRGSSASYLLDGLTDPYITSKLGYGRTLYETPEDFSQLFDPNDIEVALTEGLARGSALIDKAFCAAVDADAVARDLVDHEGNSPRNMEMDGFGEGFHLSDLISEPNAQPFTVDLVREMTDIWGLKPASP